SLDLDKLTSNPTGSLTSLSKKVRIGATNKMAIEYINDSQILKASMSNYIVSKSSDLGFSQVKFPTDVLESTLVYDISVSSYLVSKTESYSVNIGSTELKNFTIALGFIDLTNIASDTLGAISGLNEGATGYVGRTKLSLLLDSKIITYTLSTQLIDTAGKDGSTVFYIPKQSFVLDGVNLKANDVYSSFNSTTGVISKSSQYLINSTEIEKLISTLSIIDLNNVDANEILSLPADDLDSLLSSNIILANISEKFWSALSGNANVSDGLNDYMKSEDLLYSTTNNFTSFTSESITKDEITNIFNAIRILGVKDMSTFDINFQSLFLLKDNGDNEDDDTQAVGVESRVDFLRSIFIRTYLTNSDSLGAASLAFQAKALDTNNLEQEAGTGSEKAYLKIKVFSDTFDNDVYGDVLYTAPSSLDLTLTDLTLTWNAPTYTGSNLHIITYYIYLNGTNLAGDTGTTSTSFTFPSGTFDQVDEYVIAVTAQVVETIVIPPSAKISKPVVYNEYTKETEGALSSFVGVSESDMTISFYLLPNANEYVFEFTDELSNVISTTVRKEYSSGNKLERNFKDILVAGHTYSYRITAKSNNSSYSDSVYNSTSNIEYEAENEAFDVEYDEDDLIYFTNLDYQDSSFTYVYTIRIGSTDYNYDPSDDTSDLYSAISVAEYYYTIDLSKIEDKLSSGSVTITITSVKDYYANSSSSVTVICIKDSDIAFSYANNKATFTDSALLSDVLMVEVFNSESQSIIYKEMNIDSTNKNYVLDLSSLDAGEYTISYTPTNSSNNYYSFTKVSSAVSVVEASE
ncbi:MAG: hypothetical protein K6G38_02235, partial [Gammaproteobacteria bacterium]|nr:hypothetical protein [Gammaproteobacteria bacterium]